MKTTLAVFIAAAAAFLVACSTISTPQSGQTLSFDVGSLVDEEGVAIDDVTGWTAHVDIRKSPDSELLRRIVGAPSTDLKSLHFETNDTRFLPGTYGFDVRLVGPGDVTLYPVVGTLEVKGAYTRD